VVRDRRKRDIVEGSGRLVQGLQRARVRRTKLSDDLSLARGRGKGTVYQNMHDVQVMQIVIAAGETTEKVCMVTPRARHYKRSRSKAVMHRVTPCMGNLVEQPEE